MCVSAFRLTLTGAGRAYCKYRLNKSFLLSIDLNCDCLSGGKSGGVSRGGSVEPLKLNVKTYNKRMVKKSEPTQLNPFKLPLKTLEIAIQRP